MSTTYDHGPSMGAPASASKGVMDRLRTETMPLHEAAEGHRFQRALVSGAVTKDDYARWMGQMLLLHGALERALRRVRDAEPRVGAVVTDSQFRSGDLRADLGFFGAPEASAPAPATVSAIGEIERAASATDPLDRLRILGMHYVLEGSLNGGRYIAMAVRRAFALKGVEGTKHMDPYGEAQRPTWAAFKATMDAQGWSPSEQDALVEGAKAMFLAVGAMSEDMVVTGVAEGVGA